MNIEKINKDSIDRTKWKKYKFSDFAKNIVEPIIPKESGLDY